MGVVMEELPKYALSINQPWAWLIVNGAKDIENRDWPTKFRGPVAIHAGLKLDKGAAWYMNQGIHPVQGDLMRNDHPAYVPSGEPWRAQMGGIVGVADIVDCVVRSDSEWFCGKFGFVLRNARTVPLVPVKGALGFFDWRQKLAEGGQTGGRGDG